MIEKTNYINYFLVVADFIQYARNTGIPVGPGRGSGAGSLLAYSLKITTVDPLAYSLIFERFLIQTVSHPPISTSTSVRPAAKTHSPFREKWR